MYYMPLKTGPGRDFKILWKEDFISFLKDSPYFSHTQSDADSKIQRYSDQYVVGCRMSLHISNAISLHPRFTYSKF